MNDNIGTENSLVVGATEAYEAMHKETYPDWALDKVQWRLGDALSNHDRSPEILHARDAIKECAADNPDDTFFAVVCAWRGEHMEGKSLMEKYIRTYAEAHLTELVDYFGIDVGRVE